MRFIILFLPLLWMLQSCGENTSSNTATHKYSIYTMTRDGKEYLNRIDSLNTGFLNPVKEGTPVVPAPQFYGMIVKDGFYYRLDFKSNRFVKSSIQNQQLVEQASVQLQDFASIDNFHWISKDSIILLGFGEKNSGIRFAKIDVSKMTAKQEDIDIPKPFGPYNSMSVGFAEFRNRQILVGYTYHTTHNLSGYTTSDTMYVETLEYPSLKSIARSKDTRSIYPGGENTRQSHNFTDENGDLYFLASPGIAAGNNPDKPTAIFRIKKDQNQIDSTYFFNISASPIQNHGYGLWYISKGKAIIRTERKGLFTGMKDHYKVPHFDFYLVDVYQNTTKKLDLPLDKGTSRQCVLVENGFVYITVSPNSENAAVWIYDPRTDSLKKGLEFDQNVEYVLRLERLN